MRELPILFSGPMVRAILEGRKQQTRRVIKPQPRIDEMGNFCWNGWNFGQGTGGRPHVQAIASPIPSSKTKRVHCPYGAPGDRLWVKETHALEYCVDGNEPPYSDGRPVRRATDDPRWTQAHYRATDPAPDLCCERENCAQCRDHDMGPHWRPSIHMPRWASRITLEVTGVRVEQLQAISEADAKSEGCAPSWLDAEDNETVHAHSQPTYRQGFARLWRDINGAGSWDANPYVWVVEFRRIQREAPAA